MISKGFIAMCAAATLLASPALAANLVTNGGFETLNQDGTISGWDVSGDGVASDGAFPNNGSLDAVFTSLDTDQNPGVLSQDLNTVAGQNYRLTFSLFNQGIGIFDIFNVNFGGFSRQISGLDVGFIFNNQAYVPFTFEIDGMFITGGSTTLAFDSLSSSIPGAGSPFNLDDVSVTTAAIPEPSQWALMITGFALAGAAIRRRNRALAI